MLIVQLFFTAFREGIDAHWMSFFIELCPSLCICLGFQ
jgi:hypothetical protein